MNPEPVKGRQPKLPPAYRLVQLEEVDSTSSEAKRRAAEGAEDGTLIWARRQSAAYGRRGRPWDSGEGNLFLSLIVRPDCTLAEAAQLSFLTALALGDAVGSVAPPMIEVTYKWPNDVLFNARKGAGILLESKGDGHGGLEWLVIGVGANVTSFPPESRFPATSLHFEGCPSSVSAVDLLEAFSRHMLSWVNRWLDDGFAPGRQAWLNHAHGLSEDIEVRLPQETLSGRFQGLDPQGALQLALPDGSTRSIAAGEVYFPDST
ncbi:biotin--[acetyl-CoA-carboxylase] ligase [Pelagibius litoralis]|uniref:biotin--[biotin carboxyl-carrier protein] ligase n=1 Tax=Pelagibius litoralis TaxID=374515 RepID=A0A967C6K5_9PROT|nr:biotin--[acetyl-CoA-carboxylase] ligase [Pelagibius litoralis]NIA67282.1 biotin--[acetyl-CoA-carboxylase] ligase [Pelagibius litoralis]